MSVKSVRLARAVAQMTRKGIAPAEVRQSLTPANVNSKAPQNDGTGRLTVRTGFVHRLSRVLPVAR